jgi:hypothetical protein
VGRRATPASKILGGGFVASKRGLLGKKKGNQITPLRKEGKKKGGGGGGLDFVIF